MRRKRRSFLMMRARGLSGPMVRHKKGYRRLVKSVGNKFITGNSPAPAPAES